MFTMLTPFMRKRINDLYPVMRYAVCSLLRRVLGYDYVDMISQVYSSCGLHFYTLFYRKKPYFGTFGSSRRM